MKKEKSRYRMAYLKGAFMITAETIRKIAHLARLEIDASQIDQYVKDISNILAMVGHINDQDTQPMKPMSTPLTVQMHLRPDRVTEMNEASLLSSLAPEMRAGLYCVPKMMDEV